MTTPDPAAATSKESALAAVAYVSATAPGSAAAATSPASALAAASAVPSTSPASAVRYCGHCGEPAASPHPKCVARLSLEPPRYCPQCRRRLVVQVLPTGYRARCSAHGDLAA